jgi:peptidoglycan-associated lipoprotein
MRHIPSLALIIASAALLAACSSTKPEEKPPVEEKKVETAQPQPSTRDVGTVETGTKDDLNTNPALAKRSVYFDFDKYDVRDDARPVVESHGKYLSNHKERHILIQGNTDERGGSEYNLALGQKRAEAVRKALSVLGATDSQMEAVSLGKEKPKATGHDESAWQENRRADIVYN